MAEQRPVGRNVLERSRVYTALRSARSALAAAWDGSRLNRGGRTLSAAVREARLYGWLTKEPEPEVIVIDLRETVTVGPIIAGLDRLIEAGSPWVTRSRVRRTTRWLAAAVRAAPVRATAVVLAGITLGRCRELSRR